MSEIDPKSTKIVSNIILLSGFFFLILGIIAYTKPELVSQTIGLKGETLGILSYAFFLVGILEVIISKTILKPNDTK